MRHWEKDRESVAEWGWGVQRGLKKIFNALKVEQV